MRVPLSWLQEWVDVPWEPEDLAERLTAVGVAVEEIERPGSGNEGLVLARIVSVRRHEQADRLWICEVDDGGGRAEVVTSASNARVGAVAVYAPPGARLENGTEIGVRDVQGVRSWGMLCSARELGLSSAGGVQSEAEGLLLLEGEPSAVPGVEAAPLLGLGEPVLIFELTPNYAAHCQSILGIAREVSALTGAPLHPPTLPEPTRSRQADDPPHVTIEAPDGCGRYVAQIIEGVQVGPSPLRMRRRLELCGIRPINNIVDVTNYVMLEVGQPLHAFDFERLTGRCIVVRRARKGERLQTLDGQHRKLLESDLVIADAERACALAGIMGGADSEVTPQTRNILLEAAWFEPTDVFRASRRLGLRTEASIRFEKSLDPEGVMLASQRAATMIAAYGGGAVIGEPVEARGNVPSARELPYRPERINALLGTDLPHEDMRTLLERYAFQVKGDRVLVPSFRTDVKGEPDLAEEVARLYGYDRIPTKLPEGVPAVAAETSQDREWDVLAETLTACGLTEVITYSFAVPDLAERLRLPQDHPQWNPVRIANPMSEEQASLRATLLGGMLEVMAYNRRHRRGSQAFFEIGTVFLPKKNDLPDERRHLLLAANGNIRSRHWQGMEEPADVYFLKGILELLAARFGLKLESVPAALPFLHPARSGELRSGSERIGYLGELHPDLVARWEVEEGTVIAEVDLSRWLALPRTPFRYRPVPRFPAVQRDVALILPDDIPAARAEALIRERAGKWLDKLVLFDVYRGDPVPVGRRSLAFTLHYRDADRTLTESEVDEVHAEVRNALVSELGAELR